MASRLGLRLLFCAPDLAKQRTSQARGTPSWAALLLQESSLLCEHNSRVLPQMEHPCGHTIGAWFYLPFFNYCLVCDFGHCAVHFFLRVLHCFKKFIVTYPIVVSFHCVFCSPPLSHHSFSGKELSSHLLCHCPFPACFSVTSLALLSIYDDFISSI